MDVIMGGRRTGKTTETIKAAALHGGYIVCCTQKDAHRIAGQASEMGANILFPITLREFLQGQFGMGIASFHFDDIDVMLRMLAHGVPVKSMSFTTGGRSLVLDGASETLVEKEIAKGWLA